MSGHKLALRRAGYDWPEPADPPPPDEAEIDRLTRAIRGDAGETLRRFREWCADRAAAERAAAVAERRARHP